MFKKVIALSLVAAGIVVAVRVWPDVKRYQEISKM